MALIRIWCDEEKMGNYGSDELSRERWRRRDKEAVKVNRRRFFGGSKSFRDVPDGRLLRYSRRHTPIVTGQQHANGRLTHSDARLRMSIPQVGSLRLSSDKN